MTAAVTQAFAHCRESRANVVVWLSSGRAENAWQLAVATCTDHHMLVRRIDAARPALSGSDATQSGALETAALLLRGALSVLTHGGSVGVAVATPTIEAPQPSTADGSAAPIAMQATSSGEHAAEAEETRPSRALDEAASDTPPPASAAERDVEPQALGDPEQAAQDALPTSVAGQQSASTPKLDVLVLIGWQQTWENARRALSQPAFAGTFALGGPRFKLGISASFSVGTTYEDAYTAIRLARHTLAVQARLSAVQLADWSISSGLELGALLYVRSTHELSMAADAEPSALFAEPLSSAWVSAGTHLGPLWILLSGGVELLPWVPRFMYRRPNGVEQRAVQIWPVSPRVTLSIGLGRP
jgi:hypothetical protein